MRNIVWRCFECGSEPVSTRIEADKKRGPVLVICFACGAVLRTTQDSTRETGSVVFAACTGE